MNQPENRISRLATQATLELRQIKNEIVQHAFEIATGISIIAAFFLAQYIEHPHAGIASITNLANTPPSLPQKFESDRGSLTLLGDGTITVSEVKSDLTNPNNPPEIAAIVTKNEIEYYLELQDSIEENPYAKDFDFLTRHSLNGYDLTHGLDIGFICNAEGNTAICTSSNGNFSVVVGQ